MEENVKRASKHPEGRENLRSTLANVVLAKSPSLFLDLSENLLKRIDSFLSDTGLDKKQQKTLVELFEETYGEGYINGMTD